MVIKKEISKPGISCYDLMITNSVFSILLYLMLGKRIEETVFVLSDSFPKVLLSKFPNKIIIDNISNHNRIAKFRKHVYLRFSHDVRRLRRNARDVYGHDHLWFSSYFIDDKIIVFEDGLINYVFKRNHNFYKFIRRSILRNIEPYGASPKAKKIYLSGKAEIPKVIEKKVEIFDILSLWQRIENDRKEEINYLFGFESIDFAKSNAVHILLTGPFSEAGWITENEKINVYKKILKHYSKSCIVIKPHPREKTNYSKYFPNYLILPNYLPFELIQLNGISIEKLITISSSASIGDNSRITDYYDLKGNFVELSSIDFKDFYKLQPIDDV